MRLKNIARKLKFLAMDFGSAMGAREANGGDIDFIVAVYACAFAFGRDRTVEYIRNIGLANMHVIEYASRPAAVFALIERGHWFTGRVVPACNIAHVAISPEHRGGLAVKILDIAAAEAVKRGSAIASLFASTRPLYRRSGFELAGSEIIYEVDTSELYKIRDQFQCRRAVGEDILSAITPIYQKHCRIETGVLERNAAHWSILFRGAADELATLFSGFRSAYFLEKAGWIAGDTAAIKRCHDIFSISAPWVGEHY